MIAFAASLAMRLGVSQRFAKLAGIIGLIIGAILLLVIARAVLIETIEARHSAKLEARAQAAGRRADAHAADQREADRARTALEADQLRKVTSDAIPQAPLDDARRAYYRCVRLQQQARDRGGPPAAC